MPSLEDVPEDLIKREKIDSDNNKINMDINDAKVEIEDIKSKSSNLNQTNIAEITPKKENKKITIEEFKFNELDDGSNLNLIQENVANDKNDI